MGLGILLLLFSTIAFAAPKKGKKYKVRAPRGHAAINTHCELKEADGKVSGIRPDKAYTIASVSKVFTSFWAISKLGPFYRFPHTVYVTPVSGDSYDVHIAGSKFPYFDKSMLQYLVSELNRNNIKHINTLSYDESFEYATNIRTNGGLVHNNKSINLSQVQQQLTRDLSKIQTGYSALVQKSAIIDQVKLLPSISLRVSKVKHISKNNFQFSGNTNAFIFKSSELYRILKELNRNSHNYAADTIFDKLSETGKFSDFMKRSLNIGSDEIIFYNGSGYPDESGPKKLYNKASCRSVVEMMNALRKIMIKNGLTFKDIMPVAGMDASEDGNSTVTTLYGKTAGHGALLAKTGTVADIIALAGLMSTSEGNIYFHTSFNTSDNYGGRAQAYNGIREILNREFKQNGKDTFDGFKAKAFLSFDSESKLVALKNLNEKTEKVAEQDFNDLDYMTESEIHAYESSESIAVPMM